MKAVQVRPSGALDRGSHTRHHEPRISEKTHRLCFERRQHALEISDGKAVAMTIWMELAGTSWTHHLLNCERFVNGRDHNDVLVSDALKLSTCHWQIVMQKMLENVRTER